jgi:hypothetical protein
VPKTLSGKFVPPPTITDFNPKSASAGTLITVTGTNLQPVSGTAAQFTLAKQGGGTVTGFASNASATNLTFIIPAGAASGVPSVTVNAAAALTIVPPATFSLSAAPGAPRVIQGQSMGVSVSLTSTSGFNALAGLSIVGLPTGITAAFNGKNICCMLGTACEAALLAAWYQKWLVHRRTRPEEFGGRVQQTKLGAANYPIHADLMNSTALKAVFAANSNYLLPQAYPEGVRFILLILRATLPSRARVR